MDNTKTVTFPKPTPEQRSTQLFCELCNKPLLDNNEGMIAEIRRGYATYPDDKADNGGVYYDSLKFSVYLCQDCYLTDPDLCRFMNKINCRIR
jgi:hypothetical protein